MRRRAFERAGAFLDDVDEILRPVAAEHEGIPLFMAASSWAAKLASAPPPGGHRAPTRANGTHY